MTTDNASKLLGLLLALALAFTGCARRDAGQSAASNQASGTESEAVAAHGEESASAAEPSGEESLLPGEEEFLNSDASSDHTDEPSASGEDSTQESSDATSGEASGEESSDREGAQGASASASGAASTAAPASSGGPASSAPAPASSAQEEVAGQQAAGGTWLGGDTAAPPVDTGDLNHLSGVEQAVIAQINAHRAELGLPALEAHGTLTAAARIRSREMYENGYFGHTRPNGNGWQTVLQVDAPLSYRQAGENLAMVEHNMRDYDPGMDAGYWYGVWRDSPGHYANMVKREFTHVGVGIYYIQAGGRTYAYATTLFAQI